MTTNKNSYSFYKNNSIKLDVYNNPDNSEDLTIRIHQFIKEMMEQCKLAKSGRDHDLYKSSIRQLLLNCIIFMITDKKIAIPLNKNSYAIGERLRLLWFSYNHLKKIFDFFVALGWIKIKKGSYQGQFTTRFWPTQKLIDYLAPAITGPPTKCRDNEMLLLKKRIKNTKSKHYVEFNDSDHPDIVQMRTDLEFINGVAGKHILSLDVQGEVVSNHFLNFIKLGRIVGDVDISQCECHYQMTSTVTDNAHMHVMKENDYKYQYHNNSIANKTNKNIKTNSLTVIPLLNRLGLINSDCEKYYNADIINSMVSQTLNLLAAKGGQDFYYLNRLKLDLKYNQLKRVFSEDFTHGGRFYNFYQRIPSDIRKYLLIDGEPTVEVDIKACTVQMLYHLQKLECPDDPYSLLMDKDSTKKSAAEPNVFIKMPAKAEAHKLIDSQALIPLVFSFSFTGMDALKTKKFHKFAQIVMANAMDNWKDRLPKKKIEASGGKPAKNKRKLTPEESAIMAIHNKLNENYSGNYRKEDVVNLVERFKVAHDPIKHLLFSGIGRTLQYIESKIANRVLLYFAQKDIFCLCIHDSFRIAASHKNELIEVFKEAYHAELGFIPALD